MLKLMALIFIFASASGMLLFAQPQVGNENYTSAYANSLIANVSAYISNINESSYLIFQPNLAGAYLNLSYAISNVSYNPNAAVLYAERANESAYGQYKSMGYYKGASLPVIIAFTLLMLALLYKYMVPVKGRAAYKRR
jgi:hypothetical protein